jgi:hypothetical protein
MGFRDSLFKRKGQSDSFRYPDPLQFKLTVSYAYSASNDASRRSIRYC